MKKPALGIVAALLLTSCGSGETLDTHKIENAIRSQYDEQRDLKVNVDCPEGIKVEAGRTFHCLVKDANTTDTIRMTVTIENDQGDVTWNTEG